MYLKKTHYQFLILGYALFFINLQYISKIKYRLSDNLIVKKRDFNKFWKKVCLQGLELEKLQPTIHSDISPKEKENQ